MFRGRRRAERGHRVGNPGLVQAYGIHIAFDDEQALEVGTRAPCLIQSIKLPTFVKEGRFGRVEIFRLALLDDPASERDDPAAHIPDREHDAVPKAIVMALAIADLPTLALDDQTQLRERATLRIATPEAPQHLVPRIRGIADAEVLECFPHQSATLHVRPRVLIPCETFRVKACNSAHQLI